MKGKILQAILIVLASLLSFKFSLIGALIFIGLVLYNMFEVNSQVISEEMAEHVEWKYQHGMRGSAILTNDNIVKAQLNKAVRLKFPQMAFLDKEEALDWLKGL